MDVWEVLDSLPPELDRRIHQTLREVAADVGRAEEAGALTRSRRLSIRVGEVLAELEISLPRRTVVLLGLLALHGKAAP